MRSATISRSMPTRPAKPKIATFHTLRQQLEKREGRYNTALSDFIAPRASGVPDYIGAFVVTAGIGEDIIADRFKHANDDYSSILCKALADRLAEAFAERMHARVRREFWGYAPDETLSPDQLILEQYAGIRPAPGYPAQPDHTEKATLFRLLDAENTAGVKLTESFAMWPGSSVSGLYFSNAESYLFRRRQDRARPGRGLRRAQGHGGRRDRTLAGAGAELHPGAGPIGAGPPRQAGDAETGPQPPPPTMPRRSKPPRTRPAAPAPCISPTAKRRWVPDSAAGARRLLSVVIPGCAACLSLVIPGRAQREPGIQRAAKSAVGWIPGSLRFASRPGMTTVRCDSAHSRDPGVIPGCATWRRPGIDWAACSIRITHVFLRARYFRLFSR